MNLIGKEINGCYRIIEKIGENILSDVYKMEGVFSPVKTIFKILKKNNDGYCQEELFRFKQKMKGIYNVKHPNINSVYEIDDISGHVYVIMEYVEGITLSEYLNGKDNLSYKESLLLILNIARGLEAAHRNGVIHNNLTPDNILIPRNGNYTNAKITNFGFSDLILVYHTDDQIFVEKILGYLPPESCRLYGRDTDEKSDLFSLGAIFYLLLTGNLPFDSTDIEHHFMKILDGKVMSPSKKCNENLPKVINDVVIKLLNPDRSARYQNALSLIDDLEKIQLNETNFILGKDDLEFDSNFEIALIGRKKEMSILIDLYRNIEKREGSICLIDGIAGIGKRKLLEEFADFVLLNGGIFIGVDSDMTPVKKPYNILIRFIKEYHDYFGNKEKSVRDSYYEKHEGRLSVEHSVVMDMFFHEKDVKLKIRRKEFNRQVINFLFDFIDPGFPLVFSVYNASYIDEDSMDIFKQLSGLIGNRKILLICSDDSAGKKSKFIKELRVNESVTKIDPGYFGKSDIKEMISFIFRNSDFESPAGFADFIFKYSGGIPYYAIETVRHLINKEIIFPVIDKWEVDGEKFSSIDLKKKEDIIFSKIQLLKKREVDILYQAAVLEDHFFIDILFFLLKTMDRADIIAAVDYLVSQDILKYEYYGNRKHYFIHPIIKNNFEKMIDTRLKIKILTNAARYYGKEFALSKNDDDLINATNCYLKLKMPVKIYRYLLRTAGRFVKRNGFKEAVRCYKECLKPLKEMKAKKKEFDAIFSSIDELKRK